jgi:hypothetical protein
MDTIQWVILAGGFLLVVVVPLVIARTRRKP